VVAETNPDQKSLFIFNKINDDEVFQVSKMLKAGFSAKKHKVLAEILPDEP